MVVPLSYPVAGAAPSQHPLSMYPPDQLPDDSQGEHIEAHGSQQQGGHIGTHSGTHCGTHWQLGCCIIICGAGAIIWGWTYGVPNATGVAIVAGGTVVVPHMDPRWSQLRVRLQQPVLAAVTAANASAIITFALIGVSLAPVAGEVWRVSWRDCWWGCDCNVWCNRTGLASVIEWP